MIPRMANTRETLRFEGMSRRGEGAATVFIGSNCKKYEEVRAGRRW
jgi:hypothetical protein